MVGETVHVLCFAEGPHKCIVSVYLHSTHMQVIVYYIFYSIRRAHLNVPVGSLATCTREVASLLSNVLSGMHSSRFVTNRFVSRNQAASIKLESIRELLNSLRMLNRTQGRWLV